MSYKNLIMEQVDRVYQKGIANRILQFMQKIRNEYDESQARRWPMELLQNGRDVAYPDKKLHARFELQEDKLIYSHTGMPFRVKDILSIIYQVSSKRPGEETIGCFGTGFMSTHQLCERVQLDGVLKDGEQGYCPFQVLLDRTGAEAEEILEKIQESVEQIYQAEETVTEQDFQPENYNTKFTYYLETELNKQTAWIGMEDMKENILFIMLSSDLLEEISLIEQRGELKQEIIYTRGGDECLCPERNIRKLTIIEKNPVTEEMKEHQMLYISKNDVTLAAEMDEANHIRPFSSKTARLYKDFPLIGAEEFPFPVVVNSRRLQPNEPRSGIALSDNPNSKDSLQNKTVMSEAVGLFGTLLEYVVKQEFSGVENLIAIPHWKENKEHSECWVRCNLYKHLYRKVAEQPFLFTNNGRKRLSENGVYLVKGIGTEEGEGVRQLLLCLKNMYVPMESVNWPAVLSGYGMVEERTVDLSNLISQAETIIRERLDKKKTTALNWCHQLYLLGMKNPEVELLIRSGQIRIYPSQQGEVESRLYTGTEIKVDAGIPEVLKDVCEQLDLLNSVENEPLYIRGKLLHKEFATCGELPEYETSKLLEYIRRRSNRSFPVTQYSVYHVWYEDAWLKAWELLLSCGEDEKLYHLYQRVIDHPLREYAREEGLPRDVFRNAYYNISKKILERVEKCENYNGIKQSLFAGEPEDAVYRWLNEMLEQTCEHMMESDVAACRVFLNQEGNLVQQCESIWDSGFSGTSWLKRDETTKEELKEILRVFADEKRECNLYRELLDRRIQLKGINLSFLTDEAVAAKLNTVVQQLLSNHNISDVKAEYQDACTRLLAFIQEYPKEARSYFPSFCTEEEQMRLLSPKAAVRMQQQAKQMQHLLTKTGAASMEELLELIHNAQCSDAANGHVFTEFSDDVYFDADWLFDSDAEREKQMRLVGTSGEKYAFEEICRSFSDWKQEEKTPHRAVYLSEDTGACAVIEYPDTDLYKQSGWDIRILMTGKQEQEYFIEVKTHTTKSADRNKMALSRRQMQMALQHGDNYVVMMARYSRAEGQCVDAVLYRNPAKLIAQGTLQSLTEQFVFIV